MRLVVDLVRGKQVNTALDILRFTPKELQLGRKVTPFGPCQLASQKRRCSH
jgi:ribosomal protein L22